MQRTEAGVRLPIEPIEMHHRAAGCQKIGKPQAGQGKDHIAQHMHGALPVRRLGEPLAIQVRQHRACRRRNERRMCYRPFRAAPVKFVIPQQPEAHLIGGEADHHVEVPARAGRRRRKGIKRRVSAGARIKQRVHVGQSAGGLPQAGFPGHDFIRRGRLKVGKTGVAHGVQEISCTPVPFDGVMGASCPVPSLSGRCTDPAGHDHTPHPLWQATTGNVPTDVDRPRRIAHQRDVTSIAAEGRDVVHHPVDCRHLVGQPITVRLGRPANGGQIKEAEDADAVVERDENRAQACDFGAVATGATAGLQPVRPAVYPDDDRARGRRA